jgi:hypothetical protein
MDAVRSLTAPLNKLFLWPADGCEPLPGGPAVTGSVYRLLFCCHQTASLHPFQIIPPILMIADPPVLWLAQDDVENDDQEGVPDHDLAGDDEPDWGAVGENPRLLHLRRAGSARD